MEQNYVTVTLCVAFLFFSRTDSMDSPDCFTHTCRHIRFLVFSFSFFSVLVVGSVWHMKLTHMSAFERTLKQHLVSYSYRKSDCDVHHPVFLPLES